MIEKKKKKTLDDDESIFFSAFHLLQYPLFKIPFVFSPLCDHDTILSLTDYCISSCLRDTLGCNDYIYMYIK